MVIKRGNHKNAPKQKDMKALKNIIFITTVSVTTLFVYPLCWSIIEAIKDESEPNPLPMWD